MNLPFPLPDLDDPVTGPFWTHAAMKRLTLPWCDRCDRHVWYPRAACPSCSGALQWIDVATTGVVVASTVVQRAFLPAYEHLVPFTTGLVEIDGSGGCRLATRFLDAPADGLPIGAPVVVEFAPLTLPDTDVTVLAPLYRLASTAR